MLWVPVHDESEALATLAAHGVAAAPGSRYRVRQGPPHLRMAIAQLTEDPDELAEIADVIALAARRPAGWAECGSARGGPRSCPERRWRAPCAHVSGEAHPSGETVADAPRSRT
ncbi:hypothetical protein FHR32_003974 [Streptosporangium album]|uniref:GntR family transcriptional regulator / MocR family aminotransferase n=1 Tax=Streptosporangium album TaxID=47479 RepID=A0A7W7RWQ6_9ACTN|nr:hypothetical protein [Streptosporangium album]MBB4939669.1 hypothetical protein [Streptosporangium album]